MVISENQPLESTDSKKYQVKVRDKLKNPNMLGLRMIIIP